mmetsp:Transcript_30311/g.45716  ORF Transcript_30311/g.45716 Transcript_30311/m.45716 type:complete len:114 (-) Transcript_30311:2020-2361(-)
MRSKQDIMDYIHVTMDTLQSDYIESNALDEQHLQSSVIGWNKLLDFFQTKLFTTRFGLIFIFILSLLLGLLLISIRDKIFSTYDIGSAHHKTKTRKMVEWEEDLNLNRLRSER